MTDTVSQNEYMTEIGDLIRAFNIADASEEPDQERSGFFTAKELQMATGRSRTWVSEQLNGIHQRYPDAITVRSFRRRIGVTGVLRAVPHYKLNPDKMQDT